MIIINKPQELVSYIKNVKISGKTVGFVPTMGALHEGHLSLIRIAREKCDFVISSIFVNPLQFNNSNDLKLYPKTPDSDKELLIKAGCDLLFSPSESDIYTSVPKVKLGFGRLEEVMEGKFRPGHFNGVGVIVSKLFNLVNPDHAFFGQKDLQQYTIINQLVKDLSFPITLHCCPIIRENDGLAMSSRNKRIPADKRPVASALYKALQLADKEIVALKSPQQIQSTVQQFFTSYPELKLEYLEIVDAETLEPVFDVNSHERIAICIAAFLDEIRLIDNIIRSVN